MAKYLRAAFILSPVVADELGELAVDELGGVEHRDEAHEVARQHAVEQEVDLSAASSSTPHALRADAISSSPP